MSETSPLSQADELASLRQRLSDMELANAQLREKAARLSEQVIEAERYRFLFETMDEGFCIIQFIDGPLGPMSDYVHLMANPAYSRHAGLPDVQGRRLREVIADEAEVWLEYFGDVVRTGNPVYFEHELYATDRCLALSALRLEPAEARLVAVIFRDVTERKRAQNALKALNEQLELRIAEAVAKAKQFADLVDGSIACVQVVDTQLQWMAVNTATKVEFERIFGFEPTVGVSLEQQFVANTADCQRSLELWRRAITDEAFVVIEAFGEGAARRDYEMRFMPLFNADNTRLGAYLFAYDISDRVQEQQRLREAQEALRHAQKMEAVGQLTGGVAHDFNNLLGGILGALELIGDRLTHERYTSLPNLLDSAHRAARSAAELVHRLLAFSRRQTLLPSATAVAQLVEGMRELIDRSIGPQVKLHYRYAPGLWTLRIDPSQLESALLNLCINARDAMPAGGEVYIDCDNIQLERPLTDTLDLAPGEYVRLSVRDSGRGMTEDTRLRAIDPFFTTKPLGRGTGLGLSMVYGFVRQSGGQLHIESTLGVGTLVELYLPRYLGSDAPPAAQSGSLPTPGLASGEHLRIAVVEDESAMRMVIGETLVDLGHQVLMFDDAATALAALLEQPVPDLLVSDVGLPGGLNGRQLADALRTHFPGLKVLFVTGFDESAALSDGGLAEGMSVLTKPFSLHALAERVEQLLAD